MAAVADKTAGEAALAERITFPNQAGTTLCGVLTIKNASSKSVVMLCHGSFCDKVNKKPGSPLCSSCAVAALAHERLLLPFPEMMLK
jgi:hypothetical protein